MNSILVFITGVLMGAGILFIWAWFQEKSEAISLPTDFSEVSLDQLPFDGEWFVFWGGSTSDENAHHGIPTQHFALDFVISTSGEEKTHHAQGGINEDYLCWEQPIMAAHDGIVVISADGIPDNAPGEMNPQMVYGNTLMIQHKSGYVSVYAHLKQGTLKKKTGEVALSGEVIGLCGNSGNSSEPHLHFHVQSEVGFERGVALRPVFKRIHVNGAPKHDASPVKSETVGNPSRMPHEAEVR